MKPLILLLVLAWAHAAQAQSPSCLDASQTFGWSFTTGPIATVNYYLDSQVLSTAYRDGIYHLLAAVPLGTAQRFQQIGYGVSAAPIWAAIRYGYREILQASNHCPLMAQDNAFLLSAPQHDTPQ
jgi:hypothetical protein